MTRISITRRALFGASTALATSLMLLDKHGMLDRSLLHHPDVLETASEFGDPYKVLAPVSHEAHGSGSAW